MGNVDQLAAHADVSEIRFKLENELGKYALYDRLAHDKNDLYKHFNRWYFVDCLVYKNREWSVILTNRSGNSWWVFNERSWDTLELEKQQWDDDPDEFATMAFVKRVKSELEAIIKG